MSGTYIGQLSIGDCVPLALEASATLDAASAIALPQLNTDLDLALQISASLAASLDVVLDPAQSLAAALTLFASGDLLVSLKLGFLEISANLAADVAVNAALVADLELVLATLQTSIAFAASLSLTLTQAGVYLYRWDGLVGTFGSDMSALTSGGVPGGSGPTQPGHAIVLMAVDPATWAAMQTFFRT